MSGRIPPELLQKIRDGVNLVDVVSEHVVLRRSGTNHSGLCPFHSERTPSFSVSENKQLYYCYGCKRGGDAFRFVMEMHGLAFPEAVEELADRAQIALPKEFSNEHSPEKDAQRAALRDKLTTAYRLTRFVAAYFRKQALESPEARRYIEARGFSKYTDLLAEFYVGYALPEWDGLARHLESKKAPLALADELGLVRSSTKTASQGAHASHFDLLRNRLIFPILDLRGKVAGFGGRGLTAEEQPKYLNSPESLIFKKSKLLFGLFQAQKHIRARDEAIIVEGYFDVLALHAAGFPQTVATCGTSLTTEHLDLLAKFTSKVIVFFDGDSAGRAAMDRAMELGLTRGQVLYGAFLPDARDPDELLLEGEAGSRVLTETLAAARPLLDLRIDEAMAYADKGPEQKAQALKRVGAWLSQFTDGVGREVRVQAIEKRLGVPRHVFLPGAQPVAVGSSRGPQPGPRPLAGSAPARSPVPHRRPPGVKLTPGDALLLEFALHAPQIDRILTQLGDFLPPSWSFWQGLESDSLRASIEAAWAEAPGAGFAAALTRRLEEENSPLLPQVIEMQVRETFAGGRLNIQSPFNEWEAWAKRRVGQVWARFSQHLKQALVAAEAKKDAELQAQLLKDYLDVQRRMKEFSPSYDEA